MSYKGYADYPGEHKEPRIRRLLDLGHYIESHVIKHYYKLKTSHPDFKLSYKQQVLPLFKLDPVEDKDQNLVEGSLDLAMTLDGKEWGFLDVKSTGDKFSAFYKTKWMETYAKYDACETMQRIGDNGWWVEDLPAFLEEINDPFLEDNFTQLNLYCCSDFAKQHNVTYGSILKYCKNDSGMYEVRFKPNQQMFEEFRAKTNGINQAVEAKRDPKLVPREYNLGSVRCAFCPYSGECYGSTDEARKAYFQVAFPPKKWPDKINRVKKKAVLKKMFREYEAALDEAEEARELEQEILTTLEEIKCGYIELDNGHVYGVRYLKTGGIKNGPRTVIRRTKK
jgi:hypothetical protein